MRTNVHSFYPVNNHLSFTLPLYTMPVKAGFPSPADDFIDSQLDLNNFLVKNPASTFFVKVVGNSMINAGIYSEDMLIVDRSMEPYNGAIIVAVVNGEMMVKRMRKVKEKIYLVAESFSGKPVEVTPEMTFEVWGIVRYVIHKPE